MFFHYVYYIIALEKCKEEYNKNSKKLIFLQDNEEKTIVEEFVNLRKNVYDNMSFNEKNDINNKVSSKIDRFMVVVEAYPELKASMNFSDLRKQLIEVEDEIANSRKYYNGTVRIYNDKIKVFPSNVVAKIFGFKLKNKRRLKVKKFIKKHPFGTYILIVGDYAFPLIHGAVWDTNADTFEKEFKNCKVDKYFIIEDE